MTDPADINRPILEALYVEGMQLADSVRDAFDLSGRLTIAAQDEDLARLALSQEAMRTSTRIMHAIAWLVNYRAYLDGNMTEFQLRRCGRLPAPPPSAVPGQMRLLSRHMREVIDASELFYARIERLDREWRHRFAMSPSAVDRIRARVGTLESVG